MLLELSLQNRDRPPAGRCVEVVPTLDAVLEPATGWTLYRACQNHGRRISQGRTGDAEVTTSEYWTLCWCRRNCHRRTDPFKILDAVLEPSTCWTLYRACQNDGRCVGAAGIVTAEVTTSE